MTTYHPDTHIPNNGADKQGFSDMARDQFDKTQAQARETVDAARRQVSGSAQQMSSEGATFVRENPALALVGAASLGILLGMTLRGR